MPGASGRNGMRYDGPVGRRERAEQASVEAPRSATISCFASPLRPRPATRELERAFVRLRAGVAEEHLRRERLLDERGGQPLARRGRIEVRDVNRAVGRGVHRLLQPGVAVAERVHGDSAHEIEISLSVGVDEIHAVAVDELGRARL